MITVSTTVHCVRTFCGGRIRIDGTTSRAAISGMSIPVSLDLAGTVGVSTALGDTVAAVRGLSSGHGIGRRRGVIFDGFGVFLLARGLQVG